MRVLEKEIIILGIIAGVVTSFQFILYPYNELFTINSIGCRGMLFINGLGFAVTVMTAYEFLRKRTGPSRKYTFFAFILTLVAFVYGIYSLFNAFTGTRVNSLKDYLMLVAKEGFLVMFFARVWYYPAKNDSWRKTVFKKAIETMKKGSREIAHATKKAVFSIIKDKDRLTDLEIKKAKEEYVEFKTTIELKSSWLLSLAFFAFPLLMVYTVVVVYSLHKFNSRINRYAFYTLLVIAFLFHVISSFYVVVDIFYPVGVITGAIIYMRILARRLLKK